ncbi:MAG TPA: hypothetical protein VFB10_06330 [Candidatus Dormibacteraeota bacterium]|nr:hypothetical protein [Candidatus Dormibacteraeota bacterium]
MRTKMRPLLLLCCLFLLARVGTAQTSTGTLDVTVHITPTGARPEPVRQFTLYILTKSYADIVKEVEGNDELPTREAFIDNLKCTPQLKKWLKAHDVMDLTMPDFDKLVTPVEIMEVPEFLAAYQRSNSGGVTSGMPTPKFREADRETNPEKYNKQKQEYITALKKFVETHPSTITGMELELGGVNPKYQWDKLRADHKKKIAQLAPDIAQTKYLAAKADTDIDGRVTVSGLAPGTYWASSLNMDAASGDRRLNWDVAAKVQAGQTTRLELSNVNGIDAFSSQP